MNARNYILRPGEPWKPIAVKSIVEWAEFMEADASNRTVGRTNLGALGIVSTVFLGLDHNYGDGPPLLWETMVFGGPWDPDSGGTELRRHTSWARAVACHRRTIRRLQRIAALWGSAETADAVARLGGEINWKGER